MKVVGFNGSARKNGNTSILINIVFAELKNQSIDTQLIQLSETPLHGCRACYACFKNKNSRCAFDDDAANACIEKMIAADGIILGSPTYFADLSPELKSLIDRAGFVARANNDLLKRKVGAAVVSVRRAGAIHAFDSINHFFTISQMIIPGSKYWNIGVGRNVGDVESDTEGIETMKTLGQNMAWLLHKINDPEKSTT